MLLSMKDKLRQVATEMGCAGFGVTTADEFPGVADTLRSRDEAGLSGRRRFTYKNPDLAADVRASFPWAQSLVVVSWSYLPEAGSPGPQEAVTGRIARFATADHYVGLRALVSKLAAVLTAAGYRADVLVDDDRLVDRAAAVRAGVAWWGKSTMVLDPRHGPWLLLGAVATDAELPNDRPMSRDCGTCDACIPACPTGAIIAPGVLDASRCLAHWLQTGGVFPREFRIALGDRVYGCDDCLDACPPGLKRLNGVDSGVGRVDLLELLATDDEALLDRYDHFYIPKRRPRVLRRNAIIALGNTMADGAPTATPAQLRLAILTLAEYLRGSDEQLRLHSAWALGRIGGDNATAALAERQLVEPVPQVKEEIDLALRGLLFTGPA
jgi:epoxyqueuosine reductase